MQAEINKIMEWPDIWKMVVNRDKTKAMVISSNTNDTSWEPELYAKGEKIEVVSSYKFLGVDIDNGLQFNEHIECTGILIKQLGTMDIQDQSTETGTRSK